MLNTHNLSIRCSIIKPILYFQLYGFANNFALLKEIYTICFILLLVL